MEKDKSYHFEESISTIIGEGDEFTGEFILQGNLRIDGIFSGKILSDKKVIVGPTGHVKTNIQARQVIVAGRVDGNIYATEAVHLFSKAQVYGDIVAANLIVEEGVVFEGRAKINQFTGFP